MCAGSQPDLIVQSCCKLLLHWQRKRLFVEFVTEKRFVCKYGHRLVEPPPRGIGLSTSLRWQTILFYGRPLASPSLFKLSAGRCLHGRQSRKSSFCSGRGDNLVVIARFGSLCLPICTTEFTLYLGDLDCVIHTLHAHAQTSRLDGQWCDQR